ncbi:MAG: protein translocase subunit SecD [Gammaproteobacteria bacterium]|nr:protein translocase subunit SecD [Gammaproteobacteria bacterium]NIM71637.1 protein translocase subunit SecD [Gammaproteobacteria bacterium]NIO23377.1 protein translocase subunit SecD [Gammaproteobacteria bacterium]NIO64005.1 protein translocase subunit SecD [Gammaproteobacteria bacterium]NIP47108.1 protein translocase subunit SecD [Gammaproteobacteria bacterium]
MNQYPLWKYLLIVAVLVVGVFFALPNIYGNNPAVQIKADRDAPVDEILEGRIVDALKSVGIKTLRVERDDRSLLLRFADENTQLKAQDQIGSDLGSQYVVALNLAPATPAWLERLGALPMYLGLDLRGGVHFLMEVDMAGAIRQAEQRYAADLRQMLREEKIRYAGISRRDSGGVLLAFRDNETRGDAYNLIRRELPELELTERDNGKQPELLARMNQRSVDEVMRFALQQNITTLRNRVNELGVAEPVIQQQGADRIVVQLPGVQDTAKAKEILGATATLEFRMVDTEHSVQDAVAGRVPPTARLYRESNGSPILLQRSVMLSGDYITDASSGIDQQSGSPAVFITLDGKGASLFSKRTRDKIGRPMATVFIENKSETVTVDGQEIKRRTTEETVINVATIRDQLGKRFQITGLSTTEEARDLALLLRAGALAAPIEIIEERTVGPSLGQENIEQGFRSVIIGFILVLILMAIYYKVFGMVANLALTFNLVMIVAVLSMLQATLTLPGIAGIVLTTGMAVDANVLIFERIREEIRNGNTPQASIEAGYKKALSTIADANITTLIAAIVLFGFGTGPIKGFAVTLSIGIVTSMFTAIMGTRAVINLYYGGRRVQKLLI